MIQKYKEQEKHIYTIWYHRFLPINNQGIADIVDIYILNTLSWITNLCNIGIYQDDGLIAIPNSNIPLTKKYEGKLLEHLNICG